MKPFTVIYLDGTNRVIKFEDIGELPLRKRKGFPGIKN